jgi:arsenate reductase
LFRENNIDFESVNYFIAPLGELDLRRLIVKTKLKPFDFLRKNDPAFKELNLSKDSPDDDVISAMVAYPGLLQRPIVEAGDRAVIARPIEKAMEIL